MLLMGTREEPTYANEIPLDFTTEKNGLFVAEMSRVP